MKIPKKVIDKIGLTEDEFEQLSLKIQTCIIRLASENIELHDIIGDKIADRLKVVSLSTPKHENVTFMVVGMRFHGDHTFSENDEIKLEKEDDNAFDNKAIKVLVGGKKVAYVSKEYTIQLREVPNFEQKKIKLLRNSHKALSWN